MSRSVNGNAEYALALFDPASKQFSKLALTPVFWNNLSIWPPVVDATNNRVLMLVEQTKMEAPTPLSKGTRQTSPPARRWHFPKQ